ncbi:MAG: ribokinase [Fuerstiella sp.]|nr:ribokinase [Fuerstiella sp.]MCP4855955.1 ribokinase [Fuerstiella sp.]
MDLVVRSARLPAPGETLIGNSLSEIPGGKGANQAVGAARLGADVSLIGRLGDDGFGDTLRRALVVEGIQLDGVERTRKCCSGVAIIGVEDSGQNCITVVPGANGRLMPADVQKQAQAIARVDVLLLQLEVPIPTVLAAMELARTNDVVTILDPAPAIRDYPPELLNVDVVCPNESEAALLTGIEITTTESAHRAAEKLQQLGARQVVITLGDKGAVFRDASGHTGHLTPFPVTAVDTTAAGDAFAAALGIRLAEGGSLQDAGRFACAAGAVAATRKGAQPGMPSREDVNELLN